MIYNKVEVDFYVPDERLAIQVSYSITQSPATYEREVNALKRIPGVLSCKRRLILTNDESDRIEDSFGTIEVMPVWKMAFTINLLKLIAPFHIA